VYDLLKKSFLSGPVVDRNGYPYYVNPVSDGVPPVDSDLLEEVIDGLMDVCEFDCDLILAPEAMGIPLAAVLSLRTGIPFGVIRKRKYGLPGEIAVTRNTGYSSEKLYINGVKKGDRVAIVDDTLSTGGTLKAVVSALSEHGAEVSEVGIVFNKAGGLSGILEGIEIKALLNVKIENGKPCLEY
jgi:adenine phosphoribosyltransferase